MKNLAFGSICVQTYVSQFRKTLFCACRLHFTVQFTSAAFSHNIYK